MQIYEQKPTIKEGKLRNETKRRRKQNKYTNEKNRTGIRGEKGKDTDQMQIYEHRPAVKED